MHNWLRRLRAVIGIGVIWAVAWSAVGSVPRWILGFNPDAPFPIIFGALGFLAGVTFSAIVALSQRRRRIEQLSLPRFAALGVVGGLLLGTIFARAVSLSWGDALLIAPTFAAASALCASGSLAIARRARQRESVSS